MISIVIPIYNDEEYIAECLDSILRQTYTDFEVLCIDDGSTDNTLEIIKRYLNTDSRIRIFENYHKGPGWERNFGIQQARGEYITFMDHDDFVEPEWLEKLYKNLITYKADVAYCSNADYYDEDDYYDYYFFSKKELNQISRNVHSFNSCLTNKYFAPWRRLVRKQLVVENNIQFAVGDFKFDDVLFTQELMENISSVVICNEVLYYHRIFKDSITGNGMRNPDMFLEHLDTADEVIRYANRNGKDKRGMIKRMVPFLFTYFKYVNSTDIYYKKFMNICNKSNQSVYIKLKIYIIKYFIKFKRMIKRVIGVCR